MKKLLTTTLFGIALLAFTGCGEESNKTEPTKKCDASKKCGADKKEAASKKCGEGKCGEGKCGGK